MKKYILTSLLAVFAFSTQASSLESSAMSSLVSFAYSADLDDGNWKELVVAAEQDAAVFLATDGQAEMSLTLKIAIQMINSVEQLKGLSDLDKAKVVIILAHKE